MEIVLQGMAAPKNALLNQAFTAMFLESPMFAQDVAMVSVYSRRSAMTVTFYPMTDVVIRVPLSPGIRVQSLMNQEATFALLYAEMVFAWRRKIVMMAMSALWMDVLVSAK